MSESELKSALKRILNGERATLAVKRENMDAARAALSRLSPGMRARLTLVEA